MPALSQDNDLMLAMHADGHCNRQIADALDVDTHVVRGRLRRQGLRSNSPVPTDYREVADAMPALDAVAYLSGLIEQLLSLLVPVSELPQSVREALTPQVQRIYAALFAKVGQTVSKEQLYQAITFDRVDADDLPCENIVGVYVCKIRAKLAPENGAILTRWGVGFCLELPQEGGGS